MPDGNKRRREVLKYGGVAIGGAVIGGGGTRALSGDGEADAADAQSGSGGPLPDRELLTATESFDPLRPPMADMITEEMAKIGIDFQPNLLRYNRNSELVIREKPDYDMWLVRISGTPARIEPNFHTKNFYHSQSQWMRGWNWMGYEDDEVDFQSDLQRGELDEEKRRQYVYRIQEKIKRDSPVSIVAHPKLLQFYREDNVTFEGPYTPGEGLNSFWAKVNAVPGDRSEIRESWTSPLNQLNPIAMTDVVDLWIARLIYSRLLRVNPEGVPEPYEARELDVVSPTEIEITLREDHLWHDGTRVTPEDVKYTFELYQRAEAPYYNSSLEVLDEVSVVDDVTVRFDLHEPNAPFLHSALAGVMLLKKEKWEGIEEETDSLLQYNMEEPLGSGPFEFVSWDRGGRLVLERNDDFVPEPPGIERLVRVNRDSLELSLQATVQNENDVVPYGTTPDIFDRARDEEGLETVESLSIGYYGIFYNCDRPPFTDERFRRAMQHVIPRERIVEEIFEGTAEVGVSTISPGNEHWNNPEIEPYSHDLDRAREILEDAGYSWDEDGKLRFPPEMIGVPSEDEAWTPPPEEN